jgi:signal transduction histidine kinase
MSFGLFYRLALSISTLLCCALLTLGYILLRDAQAQFHEERTDLALAQAETLADGSLDALVSGDYELLERWVTAVIPADYYAYAYLARVDGHVLTHTNLKQVGRHLNPIGELEQSLQRNVTHSGRPISEVIYPAKIGTQYLANAVIGYYTDVRPFYTNQAALQIVMVIGLFLILLLGATLLIIRKHTQPLTELANTMTATSLGAAGVKRPDTSLLTRRDEVGTLAREYDRLVERLAHAYTELQNEEQHLRQMVEERTQKLQQSNQELEAFSYSVSHDLRAPLRTIDGFSQILLEEYADKLSAVGVDYLARVRAGSQHMGRLIDGLLSLSRVTRIDVVREDVNLSKCVSATIVALRKHYPQRDIRVTIAPDVMVEGDATLLGLAIDNLIGNAWKYTEKTDAAKIEFGVDSVQGETIYFIKDNGAGFDMAYAHKLFDAFQRLHGSNEFEGTGIGLATVQRILKRHNGRIWAEAEPGKGATFYFTLGNVDTSE